MTPQDLVLWGCMVSIIMVIVSLTRFQSKQRVKQSLMRMNIGKLGHSLDPYQKPQFL
jgi:hypothetical protein